MSELLPCPFCGGEAELVEGEYGMYLTGYAIYCKGTCGAKLGVTGRLCEAYEWTPYFDTEAEAIAAWNTRYQCGLADEDYSILLDELGVSERTCHIEWRDDSYDTDAGYEYDGAYFCTACGADLPYSLQECWDFYKSGYGKKPFNCCPNCGNKVVD